MAPSSRMVFATSLILLAGGMPAAAQQPPDSATIARQAKLRDLAPQDTPQLGALGFDVLNYPRMDGSTSTQPLAALIACRCFGMEYQWVGRKERLPPWRVPPGRPEAESELREFTLQAKWKSPVEERLALIINGLLSANSSTHEAYLRIIDGKSDIGLIARPPTPSELQLAQSNKIALDVVPCALDALVFLVNVENRVRNLTTTQLRAIYLNRLTNWTEVGGIPGEIVPYHREEQSGSEELMRTLVMKGTPFQTPERGARQMAMFGMIGIYLALNSNKHGVGYSVFYYEQLMSGSPKTKAIAVDGIEPTYETIRDRKYPYTCEVFVVTRKGLDENAPARRLRDWLRSPEGQAVVRESGYVPYTASER
jgi:phosphate transport system substrate-binding protein